MRPLAVLFIVSAGLVFTPLARAVDPVVDPIVTWMETRFSDDNRHAEELRERLAKGDRSLCRSVAAKDASSCFRAYVKSLELHDPIAAVPLILTAVKTGTLERPRDEDDAALFGVDNALTILERIDTAKFKIKGFAGDDSIETKVKLAVALKTAYAEFEEYKDGALKRFRSDLATATAKLARARGDPKTARKQLLLDQLRPRLERATKKNYSYPPNAVTVAHSAFEERTLKEFVSQLCTDFFLETCFEKKHGRCETTTKKVFTACVNKLPASYPTRVPAAEFIEGYKPYLRTLASCVNEGILVKAPEQASIRRADECKRVIRESTPKP